MKNKTGYFNMLNNPFFILIFPIIYKAVFKYSILREFSFTFFAVFLLHRQIIFYKYFFRFPYFIRGRRVYVF